MRGRPSHGRTMGANQRGVTRGAQGAGCPAGSDKRHSGNFAGLDFVGVRVEVQRAGSLSAASGISAAAVSEVCGGLGAVEPGVHAAA